DHRGLRDSGCDRRDLKARRHRDRRGWSTGSERQSELERKLSERERSSHFAPCRREAGATRDRARKPGMQGVGVGIIVNAKRKESTIISAHPRRHTRETDKALRSRG